MGGDDTEASTLVLGCCVQRTGGACLRKLLLLPRLAVLSLSVSVSFSFANICLEQRGRRAMGSKPKHCKQN